MMPPAAVPMSVPMLYAAEVSATAACRSSLGTAKGMMSCWMGEVIECTQASQMTPTKMSGTLRLPVSAAMPSMSGGSTSRPENRVTSLRGQ